MAPDEEAARGVRRREWMRRLGWLAAYWAGGVAALAVAAYGLRVVMGWAGLAA